MCMYTSRKVPRTISPGHTYIHVYRGKLGFELAGLMGRVRKQKPGELFLGIAGRSEDTQKMTLLHCHKGRLLRVSKMYLIGLSVLGWILLINSLLISKFDLKFIPQK